MSWDILLVNSATPVDIDSDHYPSFSSRTGFINAVRQTFPATDWSDPSLGILDSEQAVLEFEAGDEEDIGATVMLSVYGGEDPVGAVVKLCKKNGWQAFDLSTDTYLDLNNPSRESWENFERDRGPAEE